MLPINNDYLFHCIVTNDHLIYRSLLEDQDRQIFSRVARTGTPETAAYLISRYPPFRLAATQFSRFPLRDLNMTQYLVQESAFLGNVRLFRYLVDRHPSLISFVSHDHRYAETIVIKAIDGGVFIWNVILEHDTRWMDYEFNDHSGYMLEKVALMGKKDVLEMLLIRGAKTMREGVPMTIFAEQSGAPEDLIELIKKYQRV